MLLKHEELTNLIIKTFYEVYNDLSHGFLEKVYQNSMYIELKNKGLNVEAKKKLMFFTKLQKLENIMRI